MTTTQEQLDQLNEAISEIETGAQEYQYENRKVVKADLSTLYKERQRLNSQLIEENNSSGIFGTTVVSSFYRR